jgi:hypothetical protein
MGIGVVLIVSRQRGCAEILLINGGVYAHGGQPFQRLIDFVAGGIAGQTVALPR